MKLRTRLTISYGLFTLIIMVTVAFQIYSGTKKMLVSNTLKDSAGTTEELGAVFDSYLSEAENTLNLIFTDKETYTYNKGSFLGDSYTKYERESHIKTFLNSMGLVKNYSDLLIAYDTGDNIGQMSSTTEAVVADYNESLYSIITGKMHGNDSAWITGVCENYNRIYYAKRLNPGAVAIVSFFYRELDDIFSYSNEHSDMDCMIVNSNRYIYNTVKAGIGEYVDRELVDASLKDLSGAFEYNDAIVSYYRCSNGWLLLSQTSEEQLMSILKYIRSVTEYVALAGLVVIIVIALIISYSVSKPIAEMASAVKEVEAGNFETEIPHGTSKEVIALSDGLKAMVQSVKENIEAADNANKEKSKFLANTSHEIRTPMNAVIGYSEMIMEESNEERTIKNATTIRNAARNLLGIVNDILDFSKIEAGKIELKEDEYNIETVLEEVEGIIRIPAQKKFLDFTVEKVNRFPAVLYGDDIKIRQILINIANNAIKFTNEGYVRITAKCIKQKDDDTKVRMEFAVADSGIGIKPEDIGKVFGAFEQVDAKNNRKKEGSGLGLSIAKEFAKMMGGDITVTSAYGRGTVFTISIMGTIVSWDKEVEKPLDVAGKHILIVDDNETNLVMFKRMLEPYRLEIDTSTSGMETLENENLCKYDLIFMDHLMPDMNGDEVTREIRAKKDENPKYEELPIIGCTADSDSDSVKIMIGAGMNDCVTKPVNINKLEALFRRFLMATIVLLCVSVFQGCGKAPVENYAETTVGSSISFSWTGTDIRHDYMLDYVKNYEKEHSDVSVKTQYTGKNVYISRSRAMFLAGSEPDVMQIDYEWLTEFSEDGKGFYDLSKLPELNLQRYNEKYLKIGYVNGIFNAIPVTMDMPLMYVNNRIFEMDGLEIPTTWDDMFNLGRTLKGTDKYVLDCQESESLLFLLIAYTEQKTGVSVYSEAGRPQFGTKEYETMFEFYDGLVENNVIMPAGTLKSGWATWQTLMKLGTIEEAGVIENEAGTVAGLTVGYIPVLEGASCDGTYMYASSLYAISNTTKEPQLAAKFLDELLTDLEATESVDASRGAPLHSDVLSIIKRSSSNAPLGFRAAKLLYEKELRIQQPTMNGTANCELFGNVFSEYSFGRLSKEDAITQLIINFE